MTQSSTTQSAVYTEKEFIPASVQEKVQAHDPATIVIFGASGDLSRRKLIPALYQLHEGGFLPERYAIVGLSRTPMSSYEYREKMLEDLKTYTKNPSISADHPLICSLHYVAGDSTDPSSYTRLEERLEAIEKSEQLPGNRVYYLSVAPRFFPIIVRQLHDASMIRNPKEERWSRVIIEKPFGKDLESARSLNHEITSLLDESQIYRIDHYLGKETVQNILTFRFGNAIFEPLFNRKYVDNIQITVAESLGMEGKRGHYYDKAGALRDMVQNHMMQLLCLIAMEAPSGLEANAIRDEKVKVLRSIMPMTPHQVAENTVRAQYLPPANPEGLGEDMLKGYLEAEGVQPDSQTESFVALHIEIDNWRWAGVPFLLRTGKRLNKRVSEIAVTFKQPPLQFFRKETSPNFCLLADRPKANQLIFRIQPEQGISLTFASKRPGMQIELEEVNMDFFYATTFDERSPEAYERLLLDALKGDASLFTRSDEVEYAWRFITSIHEGWASEQAAPVATYDAFGEGPKEAKELAKRFGTRWRKIADM